MHTCRLPLCHFHVRPFLPLCFLLSICKLCDLIKQSALKSYNKLATRVNSELVVMATHGSIGEFNSEKETWTAYTERLEEYFLAMQ